MNLLLLASRMPLGPKGAIVQAVMLLSYYLWSVLYAKAVRFSAATMIEQYIVFVGIHYKHIRCTNSKLRVAIHRLSELPWSGAVRLDYGINTKIRQKLKVQKFKK